MTFTITDNFQDKMSKYVEKYSVFSELIFFGIILYIYYIGALKDDTHVLIKYLGIIFFTRYLFGYLTTIKETESSKINYQINMYLAIYTILILLLVKNQVSQFGQTTYGTYGTYSIIEYSTIIFYTLFLSAIGHGNTVNNIFTVISVYLLYTLQIL
jgi:hypothetical protein